MIPAVVQVAEGAGAVLAQQIPDLIWGGHEKRKFVVDTVMAEAAKIGHNAFNPAKALTKGQLEGAIRGAIEVAVDNLRSGGADAMAKLADWSEYPSDAEMQGDPEEVADLDAAA